MDQPGIHLAQPVAFARLQVDCVAHQSAFAQQPVHFISVQIVPRRREQGFDPCDLVGLFAQVGLHQAAGMFAPQSAKRAQLVRR